jgi:SAM-dependent methyltransferase
MVRENRSMFAERMLARDVGDYAGFLLPHLDRDTHLLDVGCGDGALTVGLAAHVRRVTGLDRGLDVAEAVEYCAGNGIANVDFIAGSVPALDLPDDGFDACLDHSVLEALDRPDAALRELVRVLRPGGVLAVACVEYGGLILAGPGYPLIRRFYDVRERLWLDVATTDPYLGRRLRGLLHAADLIDIETTTKHICYGTSAAVRAFGLGRAADCRDEWYAGHAIERGPATQGELDAMESAWRDWSADEGAYASFAWCRAVGRKPARLAPPSLDT